MELTLSNFVKGKLEKLFQKELKTIMKNILDEDTGYGKRELIIKIAFKPEYEERENIRVTITAESKLVGHEGLTTNLDLARRGSDNFLVTERRSTKDAPGQMMIDPISGDLFDTPTYVIDATAKA